MKARIEANELKRILAHAAKVAGKAPLPILAGVHLDAADGRITATGSNLDLTFAAYAPAEIGEPGVAVVDARILAAVTFGEGAVDLTTSDDDLTAVNGGTRAVLRCFPAEDWPKLDIPAFSGETPTGTDILATVATAATTDMLRPGLCSVILKDGFAWATDSYRLLRAPYDGEGTVPAVAVLAAAKAGPYVLAHDKDRAVFGGDRWLIVARTIAAEPPSQLAQFFTMDRQSWFTVPDVAGFVTTLRTAALAAKDDVVSITTEGSTVRVESWGGTHRTSAEYEAADVAEFGPVGFNASFLASAVSAVGDGARLRRADAMKPILVDGGKVEACLMPVRLG